MGDFYEPSPPQNGWAYLDLVEKSAWISLLKLDFCPETSFTLVPIETNIDKGKKSFAINPTDIADDKLK